MGRITLYPSITAAPGVVFVYLGEAPECIDCKVRAICHGLKQGHRYRIVKDREKEHPCQVHEGDKVKVVEYEELPMEIAIPGRKAIEGAIISIEDDICPVGICPAHLLNRRARITSGTKVKVISLLEEIDCPGGKKMKRAIIEIER
jgi:uncharacterized protein (UPF0179 family)